MNHEVRPDEYMTIHKEIFKVVDALLEGRITQEEAVLKAKTLMKRVRDPCDDPPSALTTIVIGLEPDPYVETPDPEEVRKELLIRTKMGFPISC